MFINDTVKIHNIMFIVSLQFSLQHTTLVIGKEVGKEEMV